MKLLACCRGVIYFSHSLPRVNVAHPTPPHPSKNVIPERDSRHGSHESTHVLSRSWHMFYLTNACIRNQNDQPKKRVLSLSTPPALPSPPGPRQGPPNRGELEKPRGFSLSLLAKRKPTVVQCNLVKFSFPLSERERRKKAMYFVITRILHFTNVLCIFLWNSGRRDSFTHGNSKKKKNFRSVFWRRNI